MELEKDTVSLIMEMEVFTKGIGKMTSHMGKELCMKLKEKQKEHL